MQPSQIEQGGPVSEHRQLAAVHPIRVLLTLTAVVLMVNYVETMVLPGVPIIQNDFSTTATVASWITSIVLLVGAACSPLFGRLGDTYGKKRVFLGAFLTYTVGVAVAGFAPSIYVLILARALQGLGFAAFPLALAMLTEIFPKERLASAQGALAGAAGISASLGLVVGAPIVQDFGWRYSFYTAFALSITLSVLSWRLLSESGVRSKSGIDYVGAGLLMGSIASVLVYFTEGTALGWLSFENTPFLFAGIGLVSAFLVLETRRLNPLVQLDLLRLRNVLVANLVSILSGLINFGLFYAFVYYAELPPPSGLGLSITQTGLALVPATLMMLVVGPLAGRLVPRVGPKPVLLVGSFLLALGFLAFILNRSTTQDLTLGGMIALAGIVALLVPVVNMISVSLPAQDLGIGQGLNSTLKSLGAAFGPVVATTVMTSFTQPLTRTINGRVVVVAILPSATAFNIIFTVGIGLTILTAIISLAAKNYKFRKTNDASSGQPVSSSR